MIPELTLTTHKHYRLYDSDSTEASAALGVSEANNSKGIRGSNLALHPEVLFVSTWHIINQSVSRRW
jgi:hypothetical protein